MVKNTRYKPHKNNMAPVDIKTNLPEPKKIITAKGICEACKHDIAVTVVFFGKNGLRVCKKCKDKYIEMFTK